MLKKIFQRLRRQSSSSLIDGAYQLSPFPNPPPKIWGALLTPCVTFRRVVAPLRGPGQSPVLPFACCVGSLLSVGRCPQILGVLLTPPPSLENPGCPAHNRCWGHKMVHPHSCSIQYSTIQTVGAHLEYLPEQSSDPAAQTAAQTRIRH